MRLGFLVLAAGIVLTANADDAKLDGAKAIDGSKVAAVDPGKYQIGPEDLLFVRVWREPDFTLPVAVRPDGKITMPLIGEVAAAGQEPLAANRHAKATADAIPE